jgi:hypothetical protein
MRDIRLQQAREDIELRREHMTNDLTNCLRDALSYPIRHPRQRGRPGGRTGDSGDRFDVQICVRSGGSRIL